MTKSLMKLVLGLLLLGGLPAPAFAQIPNNCDFDGDGLTDPVVVRNTGGGSGGQVTWFISRSTGGTQTTAWGISTDFFVCGDYDDDGKSDITVWRSGAPGQAAFWVLRSSDGGVVFEPFGQTGDDPTVVGDYNGDGRDDFAVIRAGATLADPSTLFFRTSPGGPVAYVPWGKGGDFYAPLDYDGDGQTDPAIQRGVSQGTFWIRASSNGATAVIPFGLSTDSIVNGRRDADLSEDLTVARSVGGKFQMWTRATANGAVSVRTFGDANTDFIVNGDWDGDGKVDAAIWRSGTGQFWLDRSLLGLTVFKWGQSADYPVANWRVK